MLRRACVVSACLAGLPAQQPAQQPFQQPAPVRVDLPVAPAAKCANRYLVVAVDLPGGQDDEAGYRRAAGRAALFHESKVFDWDGRDFDVLASALRERSPANVLFVVRPAALDVVLHRRLLLLSMRIDADAFADFGFGYLTAATGEGCERFWQRCEELHKKVPITGEWWQASVCSGDKSFAIADSPPPIARAAGFHGAHHYFATGDAAQQKAVERALAALPEAAVAEFTGCGDPQGIWLFSDRRNMQRDLHWDYKADLVGSDPDGKMPRLLAARFRGLSLSSPIVWSGACHSGAVDRVFVEGDIVSTFGRTEKATVHRLKPEESLSLAWIEAGAAALCVPIGANHGLAVSREVEFVLTNGATLGAAVKSTWDDVCFGAGGELRLDLPVEGEPHLHGEAVMQGGGANRLLIGDPALRPFRKATDPQQTITTAAADGGFRIVVERKEGFAASAWDMYGQTRPDDWRVAVRVLLADLVPATAKLLAITCSATGADGQPLPYTVRRAMIEDHDGERWLHVQANGPRKEVENKAVRAVFEVTVEGS